MTATLSYKLHHSIAARTVKADVSKKMPTNISYKSLEKYDQKL